MRRMQTSSSRLHVATGTPLQRVAALLGLLALGFLVGHVHPAHVSESGSLDASNTPVVSDDHAHHEHSVHVSVDNAPCVGCRSSEEKSTPATDGGRLVPTDLVALALPERSAGAARAPFSGLPATRAPPIG
ncbi:MAG: hypothetical protein NXI30_17330 [bacterium]|nr:hypothetical protein [bacterium]